MSAVDDTVITLRSRIANAQRMRASAEHEYAAATAAVTALRAQLHEEYDVVSTEDARTLLDKLTAELDSAIASLRAALDDTGV